MKYLLIFLLMINYAFANQGTKYTQKSGQTFQSGIEQSRSNVNPQDACQNLKAPWKVFCLEGYYFHRALILWGRQHNLTDVWPLPLPTRPIEALAYGMALAFQQRAVPQSYLYFGPLSAFIVDGWAFTEKVYYPQKASLHSCWMSPIAMFSQYCAFGRGRAMFFIHDRNTSDDGGKIASLGQQFAQAFHEAPGLLISPEVQAVVGHMLNKKQDSKIEKCLQANHQLDCVLRESKP